MERYLSDTGARIMSTVVIVAVDEFLRQRGY